MKLVGIFCLVLGDLTYIRVHLVERSYCLLRVALSGPKAREAPRTIHDARKAGIIPPNVDEAIRITINVRPSFQLAVL